MRICLKFYLFMFVSKLKTNSNAIWILDGIYRIPYPNSKWIKNDERKWRRHRTFRGNAAKLETVMLYECFIEFIECICFYFSSTNCSFIRNMYKISEFFDSNRWFLRWGNFLSILSNKIHFVKLWQRQLMFRIP